MDKEIFLKKTKIKKQIKSNITIIMLDCLKCEFKSLYIDGENQESDMA